MPGDVRTVQATVPSAVDLYLNNIRQFGSRVQDGPFVLDALPRISGAGQATVVVTDHLGRTTQTSVPLYVDQQRLAPGLIDGGMSGPIYADEAVRAAGADVRIRKARETAPPDVVNGQPAWKAVAERTRDVAEVSHDDMVWADAYLFSVPTRYGGAASQMRAFIDTLGGLWSEGKLANKFVTAMTSAGNAHGGQETTLHTLYFTFMHWGAIIVTPGYTDKTVSAAGGNPYGTSITAGDGPISEAEKAAIGHQATRLVEITARYLRGGEA